MIERVTLRVTNPVRIVTNRAGSIFASNMLVMLTETFIIQNAVAVVAAIAQRIFNESLGYIVASGRRLDNVATGQKIFVAQLGVERDLA